MYFYFFKEAINAKMMNWIVKMVEFAEYQKEELYTAIVQFLMRVKSANFWKVKKQHCQDSTVHHWLEAFVRILLTKASFCRFHRTVEPMSGGHLLNVSTGYYPGQQDQLG